MKGYEGGWRGWKGECGSGTGAYSEDEDLSPGDNKSIGHILIDDMDFPIHALHPGDRRQSLDHAFTHLRHGMILRQYLALEHLHRLFIDLSLTLAPVHKNKTKTRINQKQIKISK